MDINQLLHRDIVLSRELDTYFEEAKCEKTFLGRGDTVFSVDKMADWVLKYHYQTEKIAKVLQANNIQDTCANIKAFLYNYFQYRADETDQLLRSPACSYHDRFSGIDCKSYSILASCILYALNIPHIIRQIKQPYSPNPNAYSHVYVVVPTFQGEICIDGTKRDDKEPIYSTKKDKKMSLPHWGLNADYDEEYYQDDFQGDESSYSSDEPLLNGFMEDEDDRPLGLLKEEDKQPDILLGYAYALPQGSLNATYPQGLGLPTVIAGALSEAKSLGLEKIKSFFSIKGIKDLFSGCGSQGAFTENEVAAFQKMMSEVPAAMINDINSSLAAKDMAGMAKNIAKLKSFALQAAATYVNILNDGWKSKCTKRNLEAAVTQTAAFRDKAIQLLDEWVSSQFNAVETSQSYTFLGDIFFANDGWRNKSSAKIYTYTPKEGLSEIKAFDFSGTGGVTLFDLEADKKAEDKKAEDKKGKNTEPQNEQDLTGKSTLKDLPDDKPKMSTMAYVGIGLGVLAIIGGAIYFKNKNK